MGRGGTRTTVGLPGSGLSYSSRSGSGSSLGAGLAVAGLVALVIAALGGSRIARWILVVLGVGFCILLVAGNSHQTDVAPPGSPAVDYSATHLTPAAIAAPPPITENTLDKLRAAQAKAAPTIAAPVSAPVADSSTEEGVTTTTGANVRASPSIKGKKLRQLDVNTDLMVVRSEAEWAYVKAKDTGEELGWVHRSILRPTVPVR